MQLPVTIHTGIHQGAPVEGGELVIHVEGQRPDGVTVEGVLRIGNLDNQELDRLESEIIRETNAHATLVLGSIDIADLLAPASTGAALRKVMTDYQLGITEVARKADLPVATVRRILHGEAKPNSKTRSALAHLAERLSANPTSGERMRWHRVMRRLTRQVVAARLAVNTDQVEAWEADKEPVPPDLRRALTRMLDLPPEVWADPAAEAADRRRVAKGLRLAKARAAAHLGQEEVARKLGVDQAQVWRWEHGIDVPDGGQLKALKALLAHH